MKHPEQSVIAASIALGMLLLIAVLRFLILRKRREAETFLVSVARDTKILLLILPAAFLGARALTFIPRDVMRLIRISAVLSLIAQTALWGAGGIDYWLRRYRKQRLETDPAAVTTINAFRVAAVAAVWMIAAVAAIDNLGFNVTTLIAGLGVTGVAVALATQNILGDLFASLSIVIDKPFVLGDTIQVDSHVGRVENIGLKTTRLRSVNGEEVVVSNGDLLRSRIHNFRRMTERRSLTRLMIALDTPPARLERVPSLLRAAVEKQPNARFDHANFVSLSEGYAFELAYYVADAAQFLDVQQNVNFDVVRALAEEKIALASAAAKKA